MEWGGGTEGMLNELALGDRGKARREMLDVSRDWMILQKMKTVTQAKPVSGAKASMTVRFLLVNSYPQQLIIIQGFPCITHTHTHILLSVWHLKQTFKVMLVIEKGVITFRCKFRYPLIHSFFVPGET